MVKFQMTIGQALQGDFQVKDLNLLLVFQVNCPGCFIHALPLAEKLHHTYGNRLNVLGLSTATQDRARARIKHVLQRPSPAAYTFRVNQLQGTPSWILFDGDVTILAQWFGHKSETEMSKIINHALESVAMMQS